MNKVNKWINYFKNDENVKTITKFSNDLSDLKLEEIKKYLKSVNGICTDNYNHIVFSEEDKQYFDELFLYDLSQKIDEYRNELRNE